MPRLARDASSRCDAAMQVRGMWNEAQCQLCVLALETHWMPVSTHACQAWRLLAVVSETGSLCMGEAGRSACGACFFGAAGILS